MWISVKDGLPEIGYNITVYSKDDGITHNVYVNSYNNGQFPSLIYQKNGKYDIENVTHWQPSLVPPNTIVGKKGETKQ